MHCHALAAVLVALFAAAAQALPVALPGPRPGPGPQLLHTPYYGYDAGLYHQPGYLGQYGSLYSNYYSSPFAYSGLGWGYGSGGALYH